MSLQEQQERIVAAVKEWNRLADEGADVMRRLNAYGQALSLVKEHPEAATYLLSIWYQATAPDEPITNPEEGR